jgi:hypothetical protein
MPDVEGFGWRATSWSERLHAFSLPAGAESPPPGAAAGAWREAFGELWTELAFHLLAGGGRPRRGPERGFARGGRLVIYGNDRLRGLLETSPSSGGDAGAVATRLLGCAAGVLEGCAIVWAHSGAAGGERRMHLLRRLEARLAGEERELLCAEADRHINAQAAGTTALAAARALRLLAGARGDRARALAALEDAVIGSASLGVRAAINVREFAAVQPPRCAPSPRLCGELERVGGEVLAAAQRADGVSHRLGARLATALSLTAPLQPIAIAAQARGDRALHAEALLDLRAAWLSLAASLLLVLDGVGELRAPREQAYRRDLAQAAASQAADALAGAHLTTRLAAFDHQTAWAHQCRVLRTSVATLLDNMRDPDDGVFEHVHELLLGRVARAIVAVHAIDSRMGAGRGDPPL